MKWFMIQTEKWLQNTSKWMRMNVTFNVTRWMSLITSRDERHTHRHVTNVVFNVTRWTSHSTASRSLTVIRLRTFGGLSAVKQRSNRHVVRGVDVQRRCRCSVRRRWRRRRQTRVKHQLGLGEPYAVIVTTTTAWNESKAKLGRFTRTKIVSRLVCK